MLTLIQFPRAWGLPNGSPFCAKLETYLRMANIPYDIKFVHDPRKSPKGKLPCIQYEEKIIPDSDQIIHFLEQKLGNPLDGHLSPEQKNKAFLLNTLLSDRLYWQMLYFRWQYDKGWEHIKEAFFGGLPWHLRLFLPDMIRKKTKETLYRQGTGRHSLAEVEAMGKETLSVLADELGDQKYFLGEEPTSIDAAAFGFLTNIAWIAHEDPLKQCIKQKPNLLRYCERMWDHFYPELKKPSVL